MVGRPTKKQIDGGVKQLSAGALQIRVPKKKMLDARMEPQMFQINPKGANVRQGTKNKNGTKSKKRANKYRQSDGKGGAPLIS